MTAPTTTTTTTPPPPKPTKPPLGRAEADKDSGLLGGAKGKVKPAAGNVGTCVEVRDLFSSVPAPATEKKVVPHRRQILAPSSTRSGSALAGSSSWAR